MKLFTRYSRVNIIASVLALLAGSLAYYFSLHYFLIEQLDDTLKVEEAEILDHVRTKGTLPEPSSYRDQETSFALTDAPVTRAFHNIDRRSPRRHHNEIRTYRQLLFPVSVEGKVYAASVIKSEEETDDLLEMMMLITAGIILFLLILLFVAGRLLLRRIWRPFYDTLESIRRFNLSSHALFPARETNIDEFKSLDLAVGQMTQKIIRDYEMLKNFADDASHEMQTPLAIINSKLDLLIQDPALEEKHLRQLQAMYDAVSRLRQLNQSLLLLTKIENNQFTHADPVDLAPLLENKLTQLEDLIQNRQVRVHATLESCPLRVNAYLIDILLNNLLINAVRHNQHQGRLDIRLQDHVLRISNTGPVLSFGADVIFDRFTKGAHSDGTGLGLAIVRQICDNYGFALSYTYEDPLHVISIRFLP